MRAAVYRGVDDVRVETVPVPEIGAGEVLVRIDTCGICGTDLKKIHTGSHAAPRIFGHEMAGTIAAVGEGVTRVRRGGPGDGVSPHSVRGVFLLPEADVCAVRDVQEGGHARRGLRLRVAGLRSTSG